MTDTKAEKGSSIAVAEYSDAKGIFHSHIYYQDPELHLREVVYKGSTGKWHPGELIFRICLSMKGHPSHCR